jgi:hypothetical protein
MRVLGTPSDFASASAYVLWNEILFKENFAGMNGWKNAGHIG